jgi:hypothetical protein
MYSARSDQYELAGFPHSEISGSRVVCTSPELIAAYHVLHRLHAPRHPPCALSSLTIKFAHRKLDQHIVSLTPSLLEYPKPSLDGSRYPEDLSLSSGNLPIRLSKSTETTLAFLMQTSLETIVSISALVSSDSQPRDSDGGGEGTRTPDPMVANHVLCQLSYTPKPTSKCSRRIWWAWVDSNYRPHPYQGCALTN